MQADLGAAIADVRQPLAQVARQVKARALPVARQVLGAAGQRAVLHNQPRAGHADVGCQADFLFLGMRNQVFQHGDDAFHQSFTRGPVIGVGPFFAAHHLGQ
ncbi:hypothetical protein D3C71_1561370 [compost metagenome]